MTDTVADEKILEELKQHRRNIILSLYRHGELGAGKLWRINGVPQGSKELHFARLGDGDEDRGIEGWQLIEQVGSQQNKGGNPERVFALTDDGEQFVEEYLVDTDAAPDAYAVKIDRALDEIEELRGTVVELERTVKKQATELEALREEREQAHDELIENLEDKLNGEYRTLLKEDILADLEGESGE